MRGNIDNQKGLSFVVSKINIISPSILHQKKRKKEKRKPEYIKPLNCKRIKGEYVMKGMQRLKEATDKP